MNSEWWIEVSEATHAFDCVWYLCQSCLLGNLLLNCNQGSLVNPGLR